MPESICAETRSSTAQRPNEWMAAAYLKRVLSAGWRIDDKTTRSGSGPVHRKESSRLLGVMDKGHFLGGKDTYQKCICTGSSPGLYITSILS